MNIQMNWKVALVIGLVIVVGVSAMRYESVAIALTESLSGIITSITEFTS